MAERGRDQMGRGGTEPRRAGRKEERRGYFFFFKKEKRVKRETEDERGARHSRGRRRDGK